MAKYKIANIDVGNLITYKSKSDSSNLLSGKVIAKLDNSILLIEKENTEPSEKRMIDVSEILTVQNSRRI